MRENKYDTLLNISIVILIVSAIMLCITGYNIFFKAKPGVAVVAGSKKASAAVRDSLRNVYSSTIKNIDNELQLFGAVAADKDAQAKLSEMTTLRTEINSLLRQHGSDEDLATAKYKIEELQQKVAALQDRYTNVESENKRLQALINKLIGEHADGNTATAGVPELNQHTSSPEKINYINNAVVSGLHLFAVTENNFGQQETTASDEAEKIVGSFSLRNLSARSGNEVVVVVLQPDGKVIKNSVWDSGTFNTREGKKIYSRKIYFEPADEKQLNFSLTPDKFLKGDYTMQIWYNGSMVGKAVKTLS